MQTNELRLFVSSTFRDLMSEREVLVKKIFPKVRELCRERGAYFTEIDLRWGITAEEAKTGKVVRICLEEIDKCRPHFIGIMGSRYGWQPDDAVLTNDPDLAKDYPWLSELIAQGKSITEIEFLHGALMPKNTQSAFIYSRHNTGEQIEEGEPQLVKVRESIREVGVPLRSFLSPDELGELVLADLTAIIERDFSLATEPDALTLMRQPHDAFSVNRRRSYVANPEYIKVFEEFVQGEGNPLVLTARSGLGKSSLMAYLTHEYKDRHDGFVVTHFVGASSTASGANDIIRHVMTEIKDRYSLADEIPTEDSRLREEFPLWLAKVQGEKLVLAIDALNQLPLVDNELGWLPEFIPPNVRLVLSTTEGISYDNLHKRGWQEVEVKPLDAAMRRNIAVDFLSKYHKTLTDEQFAMIASQAACESPLFLRTVLEELRVFGVYEEYETHLVTCLSSQNERELFQHVLSRLEGIYGEETVRSVMRAIWAARYGLTENELLEITGRTRLDLSLLIAGLEYHLMQPAGLYTFFHQYLCDAVRERYISDEQGECEAHAHIARYFADTPPTPRRRDEEPWQWIEAKEKERAIETLSDITLFPLLAEAERHYELLGYWTKLDANERMESVYQTMFEKACDRLSNEHLFTFSQQLGLLLINSSRYIAAEQILNKAKEIAEVVHGRSSSAYADIFHLLSTIYVHTSRFTNAEAAFRTIIDVYSNLHNDILRLEALNDLAVVYYMQSKLQEAETIQRDVVKESIAHYGENHEVIADRYSNLGAILASAGKNDEAVTFIEKAIQVSDKIVGKAHIQTIRYTMNLATLFVIIGNGEQALHLYSSVEGTLLDTLGIYHELLASLYINRARAHLLLDKYDEAYESINKSIRIREYLFGTDDLKVIDSHLTLGQTYLQHGEHQKAETIYRTYFPIYEARLGVNHQRIFDTAKGYKRLLKAIGADAEVSVLEERYPA